MFPGYKIKNELINPWYVKIYGIVILLKISFLVSCSSQPKFDLAQIRMPLDATKVLDENFNFEKSDIKFEALIRYNSADHQWFVFDKVKFSKEFSDKFHSPTTIEFLLDESVDQVPYVHLETFVKEDSEALYVSILKLFGQPSYYNKNEDFFNGLWEIDNTLFVLKQNMTAKIGEVPTIASDLMFIKNDELEIIDYFLFEGFSYYKDYLRARRKMSKNNKYSYLEFAKNQEVDFFEKNKYLEEIKNNLPLYK